MTKKKNLLATFHTHNLFYTVEALITAKGAAKGYASYPNLNYTLTVSFILNIKHINLELA